MFKSLLNIIVVGLVFYVAAVHAASREDPLRPPGYLVAGGVNADKKKTETWFVNEILHSEGRRIAIVNNVTVKKGDLVNGARVMGITADKVTLKYKDKIISPRLRLVPVKRLKINTTGR